LNALEEKKQVKGTKSGQLKVRIPNLQSVDLDEADGDLQIKKLQMNGPNVPKVTLKVKEPKVMIKFPLSAVKDSSDGAGYSSFAVNSQANEEELMASRGANSPLTPGSEAGPRKDGSGMTPAQVDARPKPVEKRSGPGRPPGSKNSVKRQKSAQWTSMNSYARLPPKGVIGTYRNSMTPSSQARYGGYNQQSFKQSPLSSYQYGTSTPGMTPDSYSYYGNAHQSPYDMSQPRPQNGPAPGQQISTITEDDELPDGEYYGRK
jgi:hypothetical protein